MIGKQKEKRNSIWNLAVELNRASCIKFGHRQGGRADFDALKLDIRRSDDLAPFLVFIRQEFSEPGG